MTEKRIRITVDAAMIIILPMLMAYSLIGEKFHEIIGTIIFALFIMHHVLNQGWYKTLLKGQHSPRRIFQTALNAVLMFIMIAQPVSGILMSRHLYTFIQVSGVSATAREVHLLLSFWGLVLMCVHAGTHLTPRMNRLNRNNQAVRNAFLGVMIIVSAYGAYAFADRQLADYMFLKSRFMFFDFSESRVHFFIQYSYL